jgi:hypothetical protein
MDSEFWMEFGIKALNALIPVIMWALPIMLTALVGLIVQAIRVKQAELQAMYPTQYEVVEKIARNAVLIAEQLRLSEFIDDKQDWAIVYVQNHLDELGIELSFEEVVNEIEKAVMVEFNRDKVK